jgi:hypothetical protein
MISRSECPESKYDGFSRVNLVYTCYVVLPSDLSPLGLIIPITRHGGEWKIYYCHLSTRVDMRASGKHEMQ